MKKILEKANLNNDNELNKILRMINEIRYWRNSKAHP